MSQDSANEPDINGEFDEYEPDAYEGGYLESYEGDSYEATS
jgi:hypothetical protein